MGYHLCPVAQEFLYILYIKMHFWQLCSELLAGFVCIGILHDHSKNILRSHAWLLSAHVAFVWTVCNVSMFDLHENPQMTGQQFNWDCTKLWKMSIRALRRMRYLCFYMTPMHLLIIDFTLLYICFVHGSFSYILCYSTQKRASVFILSF